MPCLGARSPSKLVLMALKALLEVFFSSCLLAQNGSREVIPNGTLWNSLASRIDAGHATAYAG